MLCKVKRGAGDDDVKYRHLIEDEASMMNDKAKNGDIYPLLKLAVPLALTGLVICLQPSCNSVEVDIGGRW
jgi:hypothetical protein